MPSARLGLLLIATLGAGALAAGVARQDLPRTGWLQHDTRRPKPPVVEPPEDRGPTPAPKDAVVLFDGTNLDAWQAGRDRPAGWTIVDGVLEIKPGAGDIETKAKFGDMQLHAEWCSPTPAQGKGQGRGNGGIKLMGRYEIQVLDSYKADTYADGMAGAIYSQTPPLANVTRPPGEWQTYDIAFRRPRVDADGTLREPARVTVFHNGLLVQNNETILGTTSYIHWMPYGPRDGEPAPIRLQDHGHRVRFRNLWVRPLADRPEPSADELAPLKRVALTAADLDRFAGLWVEGRGARWPIKRGDGHLILYYSNRPFAFEPTSPTHFEMVDTDAHLDFRLDEQGRPVNATLSIGGDSRTITRPE